MADWDVFRLFLAVAREGGLAAAARASGVSAATLHRKMTALEHGLGRALFRRTRSGYVLTEDGASMVARAEAVERAAVEAWSGAAQVDVVTLSAGSWTSLLLARNVLAIAPPDAGVRLSFVPSERFLDIALREVMIGVRNARPEGRGLAGRKVARVRFRAYAADGARDDDRWIAVGVDTPSARWTRDRAGDRIAVEAAAPRLALDLCKAGAGVLVLPEAIGRDEEGLVALGPPIEALSHDQWLVTHEEERWRPPLRAVLKRVARVLARAATEED